MRLSEIVTEAWGGSHGFPGTGQRLFQATHMRHIANALHDIPDEHAKEFMTDWFVDKLEKDHPGFKPELFKKAVERGGNSTAKSMRFQQRHYYYLAHFVCQIEDPNIKDFVAHWLAEIVGKGNPDFRPARWKQFCGLEISPEEKKVVNAPRRRNVVYRDGRYHDDTVDPGRGYKEEE